MNKNPSQQQERQIELSIAKINYDGTETDYRPSLQKAGLLKSVFTSHNYSPIVWKGNYRNSDNFIRATGFCVDNDKGVTIEAAKKILKDHNLNYALITTRSHTDQAHRFRIYLPFNRRVLSLTDYQRINKRILRELFPSSDPQVLDGGRQLFASPPDAYYEAVWDREDYDVDEELDDKKNPIRVSNAWTEDLMVIDKKGQKILAAEVTSKTPIHCPFHDDGSPSAWVDYSKKHDTRYVGCSSCRKTYWMQDHDLPMEERCRKFYSYQCDILDVGLVGEKFFMEKIGPKKFNAFIDAYTSDARSEAFEYLVKNKHIRHLSRVDHIGHVEGKESHFNFQPDDGVFEVRYAPIAEKIKDNQFIEDYLERLFSKHKDFIKQWLAVYCYTNYQKLPTIVLKGPRGGGKNTFVETMMKFYPTISWFWRGEEGNFTPEYQMKLLVADESVSKDIEQYKLLKKISGQDMHLVNEKFKPVYQVRNNMNIIILSNSPTPIFVEKEEEPTDEKNNQFFVYDVPALSGPIDTQMGKKLADRLGNYIRTELKKVYEQVKNNTDCRYSIPTPITDEEKALFDANVTTLEAEVEALIVGMAEHTLMGNYLTLFFEAGYVPSEFFARSYPRGYTKNQVINKMKELKLLENKNTVKCQLEKSRRHCYAMTQRLKDRYKGEVSDKGIDVSGPKSKADTEKTSVS